MHAEMGVSCHLSFVLHSCPWRRIFGQCHLLCFVCALNLSFPQSCWSLNDLCGGCNCATSALSSSLKRTEGSCFSKEVHPSNWTFNEWQNDQTFNCGPKAWHLVYKLHCMELRLKNLIFSPWPPSPLPYPLADGSEWRKVDCRFYPRIVSLCPKLWQQKIRLVSQNPTSFTKNRTKFTKYSDLKRFRYSASIYY